MRASHRKEEAFQVSNALVFRPLSSVIPSCQEKLTMLYHFLPLAVLAAAIPVEQNAQMAALAIHRQTVKADQRMIGSFGFADNSYLLADLSGSTGRDPTEAILQPNTAFEAHLRAALECRGQSCLIADTAGSTGREPNMMAEGAGEPGSPDINCIIKHNPPVGELLKKYNNKPPSVPKQDTGLMTTLMQGINGIWRPLTDITGGPTLTGKFTGTCSPNILIWSKGTLEPGQTGIFIGPAFTTGLPANWTVHGHPYDPSIPGDFCLGLPGGMVAKDVINQAAQKCPNSNLFVAGYSQGAMVVRNGLARADPSARAKVKVSALVSEVEIEATSS